jgi:hypothetical protein
MSARARGNVSDTRRQCGSDRFRIHEWYSLRQHRLVIGEQSIRPAVSPGTVPYTRLLVEATVSRLVHRPKQLRRRVREAGGLAFGALQPREHVRPRQDCPGVFSICGVR